MLTIRPTHLGILATALAALAAGCAHDNGSIPDSATEVASGNREVSYTAPHDGKIYIRDDFDRRVAYSTEVRKNQVVRFDPKQNEVFVDGAVAAQKIPGAWHQHTLFYEKSPEGDRAVPAASTPGVVKVPVKIQVTQPSGGE